MFERLERYAGKLARAVLRGRDGGNTLLLPGTGGEIPLVYSTVSDDQRRAPLSLAGSGSGRERARYLGVASPRQAGGKEDLSQTPQRVNLRAAGDHHR